MSVAQNIGFGLEMQNRPKAEVKSAVDDMLELVKMTALADRMQWECRAGNNNV